jgi:mono/diheme cytochrome c family protein
MKSLVVAIGLIAVTASAVAREQSASARQQTSRASARPTNPAPLGIGRAATADEIKALDIDVMPDGRGLPPGSGTVAEGAKIYAAKCASCHGKNGEGATFDRLVATDAGKNFDFAINAKLPRAVGNYWPYATTLYDYTYRAMPFLQPGTLTPNETYAVVAYILALNKIIEEDAVMDARTLPAVKMPARYRFVLDDRKGGKLVK